MGRPLPDDYTLECSIYHFYLWKERKALDRERLDRERLIRIHNTTTNNVNNTENNNDIDENNDEVLLCNNIYSVDSNKEQIDSTNTSNNLNLLSTKYNNIIKIIAKEFPYIALMYPPSVKNQMPEVYKRFNRQSDSIICLRKKGTPSALSKYKMKILRQEQRQLQHLEQLKQQRQLKQLQQEKEQEEEKQQKENENEIQLPQQEEEVKVIETSCSKDDTTKKKSQFEKIIDNESTKESTILPTENEVLPIENIVPVPKEITTAESSESAEESNKATAITTLENDTITTSLENTVPPTQNVVANVKIKKMRKSSSSKDDDKVLKDKKRKSISNTSPSKKSKTKKTDKTIITVESSPTKKSKSKKDDETLTTPTSNSPIFVKAKYDSSIPRYSKPRKPLNNFRGKTFNEYYIDLQNFNKKYGHSLVTRELDLKLTVWVAKIRDTYYKIQKDPTLLSLVTANITTANNNDNDDTTNNVDDETLLGGAQLTYNRIELLNKIQFEWKNTIRPSDIIRWNKQYNELCKYKELYGHTMVPRYHGSLGGWVHKQRELNRKNMITLERITKLNEINFAFYGNRSFRKRSVLNNISWDDRIEQCRNYISKYNHLNIPNIITKYNNDGIEPNIDDLSFYLWAQYTRYEYSKIQESGYTFNSQLNPNKVKQLNNLNFVWIQPEYSEEEIYDEFNIRIQQIKVTRELFGSYSLSNLIKTFNNNEANIINDWVKEQREIYKNYYNYNDNIDDLSNIQKEQLKLLQSIDFDFWSIYKPKHELLSLPKEHNDKRLKANNRSKSKNASIHNNSNVNESLVNDINKNHDYVNHNINDNEENDDGIDDGTLEINSIEGDDDNNNDNNHDDDQNDHDLGEDEDDDDFEKRI